MAKLRNINENVTTEESITGPVKIVYCVDKDTQEAIDYWDELDGVRGEHCSREQVVAIFENEKAAKEYLKQAKILYDLVLKHEGNSSNTGFYDVYNPDACEIQPYEETILISESEAKHYFDEKIEEIKGYLAETK